MHVAGVGKSINPSGMYKDASGQIAGLLAERVNAENESTAGTLNANANFNPNTNIYNKFRFSAALGRLYTWLQAIVELFKQQKLAEADTAPLALAAR